MLTLKIKCENFKKSSTCWIRTRIKMSTIEPLIRPIDVRISLHKSLPIIVSLNPSDLILVDLRVHILLWFEETDEFRKQNDEFQASYYDQSKEIQVIVCDVDIIYRKYVIAGYYNCILKDYHYPLCYFE